jgi:hypothetical protein
MLLSKAQRSLLEAMRDGATLKIHRELDGEKVHRLHPLQGEPQSVSPALVESLRDLGFIYSNLKFPSATYILTDKALQALSST